MQSIVLATSWLVCLAAFAKADYPYPNPDPAWFTTEVPTVRPVVGGIRPTPPRPIPNPESLEQLVQICVGFFVERQQTCARITNANRVRCRDIGQYYDRYCVPIFQALLGNNNRPTRPNDDSDEDSDEDRKLNPVENEQKAERKAQHHSERKASHKEKREKHHNKEKRHSHKKDD